MGFAAEFQVRLLTLVSDTRRPLRLFSGMERRLHVLFAHDLIANRNAASIGWHPKDTRPQKYIPDGFHLSVLDREARGFQLGSQSLVVLRPGDGGLGPEIPSMKEHSHAQHLVGNPHRHRGRGSFDRILEARGIGRHQESHMPKLVLSLNPH